MKRFGLNDFVTVKGLNNLVGQARAWEGLTGETLLVYYSDGCVEHCGHDELSKATENDNWSTVQGDNCFWKTN